MIQDKMAAAEVEWAELAAVLVELETNLTDRDLIHSKVSHLSLSCRNNRDEEIGSMD